MTEREQFREELNQYTENSRRLQHEFMITWVGEMRDLDGEIEHATNTEPMASGVHTAMGYLYYLAARLPQCMNKDGRYLAQEAARWRGEYYTLADVLCDVLRHVHYIASEALVFGTKEWDVHRFLVCGDVIKVANKLEAMARAWETEYLTARTIGED